MALPPFFGGVQRPGFLLVILTHILIEPPTIDAGRLMPDTLMPITLMPVTIHAHEALLMPVTFDARHF